MKIFITSRCFSFITVLALTLLVGCTVSPKKESGVTSSKDSSIYTVLPFHGGAMHVLADDLNDDGLTDLAFTSHSKSFTRLIYQTEPRRFEPAAAAQGIVGFHPNDLIRLPYPDRKLYLSNAEGRSSLLVLELASDGNLVEIARHKQRFPRATTVFDWPGWGLGLAVAPKFGNVLTLLKGFDPLTGSVQQRFDIDLTLAQWNVMEVTATDIDGDGVVELVFLTHSKNQLWVVRYPGKDKDPVAEKLWDLESGHGYYVVDADLTGNGAPDLLIGHQAEAVISVLVNDGRGNFRYRKLDFPGGGIQRMATAVDADGSRLLLAIGHMSLSLYRFKESSLDAYEVRSMDMARSQGMQSGLLSDIDGDGWLDMVVARAHQRYSGLLLYGPLWENFSRLDAQWPMEQR